MSWTRKRISELGRVVTGKTPSTKNSKFFDGEFLFITPSDINYHHYYCYSTEKTVTSEAREKHKNQFVPKDAVLFTCIGNTLGKCAIAPADCLTNQQINSVVANEDNDAKFIYYLLNNNIKYIKGLGGGSATPIINKTSFESIEFLVPPFPIQQKIAAILSGYDDLIDNNLKRIALLEKSARLLYEEWFVRLRFPGYEHTNIVDGVPGGWEKTFVPDIIEINPKTVVPKDGENWHVDMASLATDCMVINDPVLKEGNSGSKFQNGDTLFARITPCLENGKTGYVNFLEEGKTAFGSTEFIVLRGKRVPSEFVYCLSRTYGFRENAIKSMVGSSGRQRVQVSCFDEFTVPLPPKTILDLFEESVRPCFKQIKALSTQNQKLKQARNILLPKLINGEIPV